MDSILDYPRDWMEARVSGTRVSKAGVVQDVIDHLCECDDSEHHYRKSK